ncbi:MAG TPA: GxxExxY protein [Planctomycetaceae bacterium]|nr:GxxExxY protein [Planctomycetaceae bacterium]
MLHEELTGQIIGAAIEVHRELGPGLLESAYHQALCHELNLRKIPFRHKQPVPLSYKRVRLDCDYEFDFLVDEKVLVELKAVLEIHPVFEAQLLTHMKLTGIRVGLLINFNVPVLKDGVIRRVL